MTPTTFPEANAVFGAPKEMTEEQCQPVPAFRGTVPAGSCAGVDMVVVAWQPTEQDRAMLALGQPVFLTVLGGLPPHFLTTNFHAATHPA